MIRIKFSNETYYHNVAFTRVNDHVITLKGDTKLLSVPNTSGFCTYKATSDVLLGDFTDYNTVYRITDEFIQYSNDGSKWEEPPEPTRSITLQVQWDDADNADGIRPSSVTITTSDGEAITLTPEDGWSTVFSEVPISKDITITSVESIDGYATTIYGTYVVCYHEYIDPTPSIEERVENTEDAICEITEYIEQSISDIEDAICELTEV